MYIQLHHRVVEGAGEGRIDGVLGCGIKNKNLSLFTVVLYGVKWQVVGGSEGFRLLVDD